DGVGIARVGVIALVDQQDRARGAGVPRPPVVVLAADRPGGAGGPLPPALYAALEPAELLGWSDHRRPRLRALGDGRAGALDRRSGGEAGQARGPQDAARPAHERRSVALSAAARSAALTGHTRGALIGWNCEISRST